MHYCFSQLEVAFRGFLMSSIALLVCKAFKVTERAYGAHILVFRACQRNPSSQSTIVQPYVAAARRRYLPVAAPGEATRRASAGGRQSARRPSEATEVSGYGTTNPDQMRANAPTRMVASAIFRLSWTLPNNMELPPNGIGMVLSLRNKILTALITIHHCP